METPMMKKKILLAEDDKNLGILLKNYLEAKDFATDLCVDGEEAYKNFMKNRYDFCILDVMMPKKDGFTVAKEIRKVNPHIPILFLTAKSLEEDKITGFQVGGDDYMTKPFSMEELLHRIKAILKRFDPTPSLNENNIYQIGKYTFDYNRHLLIFNREEQKLTSKEAGLLRLLCQNMNHVLNRNEALLKVWDDDSYFNARSMDVYITKLRKYLKKDPTVELINVHGVGFKLITTEKVVFI